MVFVKGDPNINRKGRLHGSFSLTDILRRKLQEVPKGEKKMNAELLIDTIFEAAWKKKDHQAQKLVMNYIDGLPIARIGDVDGKNIKLLLDLNIPKDDHPDTTG